MVIAHHRGNETFFCWVVVPFGPVPTEKMLDIQNPETQHFMGAYLDLYDLTIEVLGIKNNDLMVSQVVWVLRRWANS